LNFGLQNCQTSSLARLVLMGGSTRRHNPECWSHNLRHSLILLMWSLRLRMKGHKRLDCCHNITSRQPVHCSRLQQVSGLVCLVLFAKSPALNNGHSLRIFTKRVRRIYRESTRGETSGKNRKCVIRTCASSNRSSVVTTTTKPFDTNIAGDQWHTKMPAFPSH
jgi:hypothetical protein